MYSFEPAGLAGLGWLAGPLLIGIGAIYEKSEQGKPVISVRQNDTGLSAQFQKVLPVALVLVLFWYVFTSWRIRGGLSNVGLWMSVALGLMLIVRLGIRAGEAELNNYWQLFKNLGEPAFICDGDGKIVLSNPAFRHAAAPRRFDAGDRAEARDGACPLAQLIAARGAQRPVPGHRPRGRSNSPGRILRLPHEPGFGRAFLFPRPRRLGDGLSGLLTAVRTEARISQIDQGPGLRA